MCRKYHSNSCHCSIPAGNDSTPGCFCCEQFPWWRAKDKSGFHPNCSLEWLITSYDKGKQRKKKLMFLCVCVGGGSSSNLFILIYAFVCYFHLRVDIEKTDWNAGPCRCCCLSVHWYWHVVAFFLSIMQLVAIQLRLYLWLFFPTAIQNKSECALQRSDSGWIFEQTSWPSAEDIWPIGMLKKRCGYVDWIVHVAEE